MATGNTNGADMSKQFHSNLRKGVSGGQSAVKFFFFYMND